MKRLLIVIVTVFIPALIHPAWAQMCNNASLNGKYVLSGQGDTYGVCILGLCLGHATVSTTGYIVADGNGNITSARLFQAMNSGVQDSGITQSAGTYSVTDCNNGTLSLMLHGQLATYNVDLNNVDKAGIAHSAAALVSNTGYKESLQIVRTVDPTGPNACGSGFSLNGVVINGIETGHDNAGNPVAAIVALNFNSGSLSGSERKSTLSDSDSVRKSAPGGSGSERKSTPSSSTTAVISGTYAINSDCSVIMSRITNGTTVAGAHIVSGGDPLAPILRTTIWQGDTTIIYQDGLSYDRAQADTI